MVSIDSNQAAEAAIETGTPFVLNLLQEGRTVRRHFDYRSRTGDQPFSQVKHPHADNGCFILEDALAYLECEVQNTMDCGDHQLIYATVSSGDVLETMGVTAVQHRKSAVSISLLSLQ